MYIAQFIKAKGAVPASFVALAMFGAAAYADDARPSASEISAAVSDATYQGSMSAPGSTFAEYYAPDGSITADGYTGKWRADEGMMCFQYGDTDERCFDVKIDGPSMVMFKNGEIDGNGMLIPGNPNEFK